jgi:uncharacterized protein
VGTTTQLTATAVAAAAAGVVAGLLALGVGRTDAGRARAGWVGAGLRALLVAAAVTAVPGVVVIRDASYPALAAVHLAFLVLMVTVPVLAAGALAAHLVRRRRGERLLPTAAVATLAVTMVGIPAVGLYATRVEPYRLRVDRVEIATALVDRPVRIGVVADIQTRRITGYEREAVARLLAQEPDLVLIAGDLHQGSSNEFEAALDDFRSLLADLAAVPAGAFVVTGDSEDPGQLDRLVAGTGVTILDGAVTRVDVRGQTIVVGGVDTHVGSADADAVYDRLDRSGGEGFRILLAHMPDAVLELGERRVELVVAGHTHGGQVAIPFLGPPVVRTGVPRSVAAGGLGEVEGTPVYVSTGVGMARNAPEVRLFVRPSVGVVDLVPAG